MSKALEGVRVLDAYGVPAISSGEGAEVSALPLTVWVVNDLAVGRAIVLSVAGRRTVALPPLNTVLAQAAAADVLPSVETALGRRIDPDCIRRDADRHSLCRERTAIDNRKRSRTAAVGIGAAIIVDIDLVGCPVDRDVVG